VQKGWPQKTLAEALGISKGHASQLVKRLRSGGSRRLRLISLPAYALDLNPDEGVWRWLKRSLGNVCCK
jgi:transcriptional regulator with XRE-family HTH domain